MPLECKTGFTRAARIAAALLVLAATSAAAPPAARAQAQPCTPQTARVVSLQGNIALRSAAKDDWQPVRRLDTPLCRGDRLRTGANSRAALFIPPENLLRVDQNTTVSVHIDADETIVEFFIDEGSQGNACGAGYAISRFPRKFKIHTPFSYAAVEGTEFLVAMTCSSATVSVFEGKVSVEQRIAQATRVVLESGQTTTVGPSQPPAVQVLVKPADAVQWALYYPPIADPQFGADPIAVDCETISEEIRPACLLERAEALLRAGRVDEAQADIRDLLVLQPNNGDAYALRAVISVVKNEKAAALRDAQQATTLSPNGYRPWLALSYAHQAEFKLEQALETARKAAALAPSSALAQARVAELLMSLGRIREAEKAARQAVAAEPRQARGHVILGFVHLAQINTKAARQDFNQAIELDSTDPLPRLGMGLAIIRQGKLKEGREQIEIAVSLDPTNSLVRSYVGKAYYEENTKERDALAASQFSLAKELDPNDPTPWFYDAILKQSRNRPVEALEDLQESIELNDDRSVYRSKLLLDEDMATRQTSQATLYNQLGFSQLGLLSAAESLALDPASSSAHRFLSDIYATLPRHELSRASELLQAQLRQPLGARPLQAQLANDILFKDTFFGPASIGLNEFNPLFSRNKAELQLFGFAQDDESWGDQIILNGLSGPVSFALSQFYTRDNGYRPNNDNTLTQYDAFLQALPSPETSLQIEATHFEKESGDLVSTFDPTFFSSDQRSVDRTDTYRFGLRHALGARSDVLASVIKEDFRGSLTIPDPFFPFFVDTTVESWKVEAQYLTRVRDGRLLLGVGYFGGSAVEELPFETFHSNPTHANAYGYAYLPTLSGLPRVQLGLSYDDLHARDSGNQERYNPKFGMIWRVHRSVTLRAAAFSVLKRRINSDQGLEPTQLAGFNQFFDDPNGTVSHGAGGAVHVSISPSLNAGAELFGRSLSVPRTLFTGEVEFEDRSERSLSGYLYWTPVRDVAIALEPRHDHFRTGALFSDLKLTQVPVSLRAFLGSSVWLGVRLTAVWETGTFVGPGGLLFDGSDQFVVTDAALAYRLPRRLGTISLEANNLFDESFQFQEIEGIVSTRFTTERRVFLRVSLSF